MSRILFDAFEAPVGGLTVDATIPAVTISVVAASVAIGLRPVLFAMNIVASSILVGTLPSGAVGLGNGRVRRIH